MEAVAEQLRTALLVGGSGLVGRSCLQALLDDPAYGSVILLGRRELSLAPNPKLSQRVLPLENLASLELPPIDDAFCALGTTIRKAGSQDAFRHVDYEMPLAAADHALKSGAKQFVLVSSIGADAKSKNFYLRIKGELEDSLRRLPFRSLHLFRPSLLLGKREEFRLGEVLAIGAARLPQFLMVGSLRPYHPIPASVVGRAMVSAAKTPASGSYVYEYNQIVALAA